MRDRTFQITSGAVVLVLLFTVIALALVSLQSGPKLREITLNSNLATALPQQRVALAFNQSINADNLGEIKLTPAADITASVTENKLILTFARPLLAGVTYRAETAVTSATTGTSRAITGEFTTDPLDLTVLKPRPAETQTTAQDKIIAYRVAASGSITNPKNGNSTASGIELFEGARITDFARGGDWLAVTKQNNARAMDFLVQRIGSATARADGAAAAATDNPAGRTPERAAHIPAEQTIIPQTPTQQRRALAFSDDGALLGIKFFNGVSDNLHLYPVSKIDPDTVRSVRDEAGNELAVTAWAFIPGSSEAVLQTESGSYYRVPLNGAATQISAEQVAQLLAKMNTAEMFTEQPESVADVMFPLPTSKTVFDGVLSIRDNSLLYNGASLYEPAAESSKITGVCVSANEQFALARVTAANSQSQLSVIELATGKTLFSAPGVTADWCR
ncbi:hypothetical protein KJY78_04265 [Canibacter sp. lx-45]|uniref:hypothetical protein n=1 Tax=Canibacter zhuwentaonis TaxID=2837491 RepID=UPI001BDC56FF|nr:hypothetical protein [Canibacter zhuwentaonis]MBT1035568.1 hypothetical protein [Canibacter zhuwentaonis]